MTEKTASVPKSTRQKTASKTPSKIKKYFKSVIDLGNHWIKAYVEGYDYLREPSWYARCLNNTSDKIPGHVKYVDGDREDLKNTCWLVGTQAARSNSSDLIRLVDDYTGKSSLWLQYFLGTLAHLPQVNSEMAFEVTVTCNDVKRHEPVIRKNEGTHKVELAGVPVLVQIKINAVYPEGIAALKSQNLDGAVTICDIGGGNTSITRFFNSELVGEPVVKDFGAEYLIEKIAANSDLKALIKQPPSKDVINRSIETGVKFKKSETGDKIAALYYGESDLNFYSVYELELKDFIDCKLREVTKQLEQYKLAGDKILIIGGGSKLPLLSAALKKKGFLISDNGAFDNLKGLVSEVM
ncbi:ParM/StbA family protein [Tolypothrix campylonemoides VB511288_2]|uniref:ParM/StbA family protein n=1 Tax=Tolypothrix campylonemoides VB511288_2 TaxID=3232311 RepID=A0ABW8XPB0_9CYAN